jgi:hypothetical protein
MTNTFPNFWFESNSCWGEVYSIKSLNEMKEKFSTRNPTMNFYDAQLCEVEFDASKTYNFGFRHNHTGILTLRDYLRNHGIFLEKADRFENFYNEHS